MEKKAGLTAVIAIALFALLTGCSFTPQSLQSEPDAESQVFRENYEEIYRRLMAMGERCYPPHKVVFGPGSFPDAAIEAQGELHKDSGSADFRLVASSMGIRGNYFLSARIEKAGTGSRVTTKVNNPLIKGQLSKIIFRWADGDQNC